MIKISKMHCSHFLRKYLTYIESVESLAEVTNIIITCSIELIDT